MSLETAVPTNPKTMGGTLRKPASRAIYVILFVALIIRLYHISFPVGGFQAWRQADTAAIARNFYENGFNFLYPQIDWGGNTPGYVETEFPLYPFLVALLYKVFSPSDMIGRLISVACSVIAILGLYNLVKRVMGDRIALWSAGLYAILPLNIFYTRAFMPESMMIMSSILGVYFFIAWVQEDRGVHLCLSAAFISLAALLKIPCLYLGLPLLYLTWARYGLGLFRQWRLWAFAAGIFIPVALWYYHAHQIYLQSGFTFGIWMFGTNKWGMVEPLLTLKFYNDIFFKSIAERHLTYGAFVPILFGLFLKRTRPLERVFDWWFLGLLSFVAIVPLGHQIHEYYQLPFAIPASVFVAKFFCQLLPLGSVRSSRKTNRMNISMSVVLLAAIAVLSFLRVKSFMGGEKFDNPIFQVGNAVQQATLREDLTVAVSEGDPVYLYAAHRKGWNGSPYTLTGSFLQERVKEGAKVLFGDVATFERANRMADLELLIKKHPSVLVTDRYFVLRIDESR